MSRLASRKRVKRSARRTFALGGCALLLAAPVAAQEEAAPSAAPASFGDRLSDLGTRAGDALAIPFDIVVLRPLEAGATVIGAVLFVPVLALGFANHRETLQEGFEVFVQTPAKNVYQRPLGEF